MLRRSMADDCLRSLLISIITAPTPTAHGGRAGGGEHAEAGARQGGGGRRRLLSGLLADLQAAHAPTVSTKLVSAIAPAQMGAGQRAWGLGEWLASAWASGGGWGGFQDRVHAQKES